MTPTPLHTHTSNRTTHLGVELGEGWRDAPAAEPDVVGHHPPACQQAHQQGHGRLGEEGDAAGLRGWRGVQA